MLDSDGLYNMKKTNEWSAIEDLLIFATFSKTSDQQYRLHSRLMVSCLHDTDSVRNMVFEM